MKKHFLFLSIGILCATMVGCKPKVDAPDISSGRLNVSKYVAVGNSITAGYADNALYYDGQQVSYANLLAGQFKLIGGGEFKQPLVDPASPGIGASLGAHLILAPKTDCLGITSLSPVPSAASGDFNIFLTNISDKGPFNNMGVPGAKSITTVYPGYGNLALGLTKCNPFFARMIAPASYASASILSEATKQNPTFFTLFLGSNDVLLHALAGAASDSITPTHMFDAAIDAVVSGLTANGAQGIVANIPDIPSIPHFTTVPYNGLVLKSQAQVDGLNAALGALGITFQLGQNPFIIADAGSPGGRRQIKSDEYILLSIPQDSLKCYQMGSVIPIPDKYVLTATEVGAIRNAIAQYNTKLKSVADAKGLAFVDVNGFLAQVQKGITYNGINLSTAFVSGGAFSLDGVHLTPIGNALLANEFIKAINSTYGSTLPMINATEYTGAKFP